MSKQQSDHVGSWLAIVKNSDCKRKRKEKNPDCILNVIGSNGMF